MSIITIYPLVSPCSVRAGSQVWKDLSAWGTAGSHLGVRCVDTVIMNQKRMHPEPVLCWHRGGCTLRHCHTGSWGPTATPSRLCTATALGSLGHRHEASRLCPREGGVSREVTSRHRPPLFFLRSFCSSWRAGPCLLTPVDLLPGWSSRSQEPGVLSPRGSVDLARGAGLGGN